MDFSSGFGLLPVHPADYSLLSMCIDDQFYIDKCMPFGCSIDCSTFEKFLSLLRRMVAKELTIITHTVPRSFFS